VREKLPGEHAIRLSRGGSLGGVRGSVASAQQWGISSWASHGADRSPFECSFHLQCAAATEVGRAGRVAGV
jgi:hypothetical protein